MASWSQESQAVENYERADPKPERRLKAAPDEWARIRERFAGECCVACGLPGESLHHVVPKSQGGDDVYENLVVLCGDGTRGCHGKLETHAPGWERVANSIRPYVLLSRPRCVYVIEKIGWDRFNARYPLLSESGGVPPAGGPEPSLDSESNEFEKPRRGQWDLDWLPDYREEDTAF